MATQKSIKGTQTEKNLVLAFISESTSYTRYTYYSQQATKESYFPVAEIFRDTAENELHHAKVYYRLLENNPVEMTANFEVGVIGDTVANLEAAMEAERVEGVLEYREAAKVAREEGFDEIAEHFESIAKVEEHHRLRFERYLKMVKEGTLWKREKPVIWKCLVCGYRFEGTEPPMVCPACDHPYQHYMALDADDII